MLVGEDLFLVSKLPHCGNRPAGVAKYLKRSLENLQIDYLDVYLIHAPYSYQEVDDLLYPFKNGKILLDTTTDHIAVWRVNNFAIYFKTSVITNYYYYRKWRNK